MARRSRMSGDFKLRRTLRNIHQNVDNELRPAMQEAANKILATMKSTIPRDTGEAAGALKAFVSKSGLDAQIGIRGKKDNRRFFYLRFLEYGTKGYDGKKRAGNRSRSVKNKSDGSTFFGKYPSIPALPANPWLRPSLDVNREVVMADIRAAVNRTLKKASQGGNDG
ncbi:HK97-gp10 family putative phage morphogenesis protein [Pseudomonas coronafaciens]|uniref:HK97-gp10 family putative phage morphogenesis protein n=1 Tax=Pseudomonas coronafaciens TaxID=53409 RepID=UPI0005A4DE53|nr:HK97-gp10 family putative phage morphogenesis protein [Pseudomonas coronafaciens]KGS14893.1 HK97 family phage protein [Pseudomonas coronafaciens]RMU97382.1 Prophage PssSM-03, HK97/gp10 protein [Pseudomonas coronafaciens pv. coronafaciens]